MQFGVETSFFLPLEQVLSNTSILKFSTLIDVCLSKWSLCKLLYFAGLRLRKWHKVNLQNGIPDKSKFCDSKRFPPFGERQKGKEL